VAAPAAAGSRQGLRYAAGGGVYPPSVVVRKLGQLSKLRVSLLGLAAVQAVALGCVSRGEQGVLGPVQQVCGVLHCLTVVVVTLRCAHGGGTIRCVCYGGSTCAVKSSLCSGYKLSSSEYMGMLYVTAVRVQIVHTTLLGHMLSVWQLSGWCSLCSAGD
jgi:hypothetical protein